MIVNKNIKRRGVTGTFSNEIYWWVKVNGDEIIKLYTFAPKPSQTELFKHIYETGKRRGREETQRKMKDTLGLC